MLVKPHVCGVTSVVLCNRQVQKSDWINSDQLGPLTWDQLFKKMMRLQEIMLALIFKLTLVKSAQTQNSFGLQNRLCSIRGERSELIWCTTFVPSCYVMKRNSYDRLGEGDENRPFSTYWLEKCTELSSQLT